MGTLIYNGRMNLCIDDHVLAHVQVVILTKLRRHEAFAFTWNDGGQATVCWINRPWRSSSSTQAPCGST
jgi:hypothetical protein